MRAAALYRVSTKRQIKDEDDSIPIQQHLLRSYAAQKGMDLVKEYLEPGISAYKVSSENRDILNDAIADAERKMFDVLLLFKTDRLSRQALQYPIILERFNKAGVTVIAVADGGRVLAINDMIDLLVRFMEGWQAQSESRNTSIRVTQAMLDNAKKGKWSGGRPPYGFRCRNHLKNELPLEIDNDEAAIIRDIARLYLEENYGSKKVAVYLNSRGLRTREGKLWSDSRVRAVIQNPIITGVPVYNRTQQTKEGSRVRVRNSYDLTNPEIVVPQDLAGNPFIVQEWAIIPMEEWLKITHLMRKRANNTEPNARSFESNALLSGFLKCGYCGHGFIISRTNNAKSVKPNGKVYTYLKEVYRCITHARIGSDFCEGQGTYSKKKIEGIFMAELETFLANLNIGRLEEYILLKEAAGINRMQKEFKELEQHQIKIRRIMKNWVDRLNQFFADPNSVPYSEELMASEIQKAQQELTTTEEQMTELKGKLQTNRIEKENMKQFAKLAPKWFEIFKEAPVQTQKRMLSQILEKVTIWRDRLEIAYNVNLMELGQADMKRGQGGNVQLKVVIDM